ncbi:MAG: ATP-dependent zinc metalloprotease FtsH [Myxococcales bacterium]|jgi:cell division protease FtsH
MADTSPGNSRGKKSERPSSTPPSGGSSAQKPRLGSPLAYLLLILLGFFLFRSVFSEAGVQKVPYSRFKQAVREDRFSRVVISNDWVKGYLVAGEAEPGGEAANASARLPWMANRIPGDDEQELVALLESKGITYEAQPRSGFSDLFWIWVLPIGVALLLWGFMFRRAGSPTGQGPPGIMTFGKSRARIHSESDTGVSFRDVAGIDEAVDELKEIVEFLRTPEKFRRLGGRIPKGVLLVGPPGTGKTLLARAVAGEAGVPFFSLTGSEFVEMFVGVGAARVRDLFQQAQARAPCIVFIDELDAIGKTRNGSVMSGHDEREQTLNQLLAEMDGFDSKVGLIVLAATNRPEILDQALMRPGRFDRQVLVDRPDRRGREQILQIHARNIKLGPDVNLKLLASRTPGFAGADLANVCNEAALLAARRNHDDVRMEDFEEAIERVVAGLEKKNRRINEREKQIVAFHESGHAVVGWKLQYAERVHKVSIIPRGLGALGYTMQMPLEDRYLMSLEELRDKIAALMGGRAAEEAFVGTISTGAANDLKQATEIAKLMVREYGMSMALGPVNLSEQGRSVFLGAGAAAPELRNYSEQTALAVDDEVRRLVQEGLDRARQVIKRHREEIQRLAAQLLISEVVDSEMLESILGPKIVAPLDLLAPQGGEGQEVRPSEPYVPAH